MYGIVENLRQEIQYRPEPRRSKDYEGIQVPEFRRISEKEPQGSSEFSADVWRLNSTQFQMTPLRIILTYNEAAFTTNLFRNGKCFSCIRDRSLTRLAGTTKQLSFETLTSFFKENKFPKNWFRQEKPFTFTDVVALNTEIFLAHPIQPGANDKYGKYVGYDYNFGDVSSLFLHKL